MSELVQSYWQLVDDTGQVCGRLYHTKEWARKHLARHIELDRIMAEEWKRTGCNPVTVIYPIVSRPAVLHRFDLTRYPDPL